MAVAFLIAIGSTAYTDHTQAAQAQPTQGQEQQMQQQMQQGQGQQAIPSYPLNLPKQSLAAALNTLSEQTDMQVLFPYDIARSHSIGPLQGNFTIEQALVIMLRNTGLHGGLTDGGVITISQTGSHVDINQNSKGKIMNTSKRKTLLATMVGLFAAGGLSTVSAQDQMGENARAQGVLEEIVVTATRRETSLNDTAVSIAAIGGEEIARRNLSEMNDYLRTVPGVNFVELGLGDNAVVIRGLGIDPQLEGVVSSPATGIYLGEISLAGLGVEGGSSDLKMIDLQRVEVLRGPQGTLFGSGAMAGAVRNIPNAPVLNELSGNIKTSYSSTAKNGGGNNKLEGVINIPLIEDVLAVRAVAYRHDTSGYVKNVAGDVLANDGFIIPGVRVSDTLADDPGAAALYVNETDVGNVIHKGGRLSALWTPIEDLSVTLQHIYQDAEQEGQPYVELGVSTGDYEQITHQFGDVPDLAGLQSEYTDEINITNLVLEYDLGWANLLSSSAWLESESEKNQEQSPFDGSPGVLPRKATVDVFSQELRLVSELEGPFQYAVGIYYEDMDYVRTGGNIASTDETRDFILGIFGFEFSPFGADSHIWNSDRLTKHREQLSYYGEFSYDFSEQLELTLGARRFDYERSQRYIDAGIFGDTDNRAKFDETGTSLKANLSYTPNDDMLFYGQWAEGFRLGNALTPLPAVICDVDNDGILDGTNAPLEDGFDSDTTENFELGAKLTLLDSRLQVNVAAYRVDWEGIPISVSGGVPGDPDRTCFSSTIINAGEARSQGFELETVYQLNENLRVNLGGAYTNAELTEDSLELSAVDGDRLPSSPDYSINLGLEYNFELAGHPSYVSSDYRYVSGFYNLLGEDNDPRSVEVGDYGQVNVSAGISFNQFNVELYAHNLTDEDALTHADTFLLDSRAYRLRPRTIGLNVGYQF